MLDRLTQNIEAVCPIFGVFGTQGSVTIQYKPEATGAQQTAAQSALESFDWSQAAHDAWLLLKLKATEKIEYDRRVLTGLVQIIVDSLNDIRAGSVRQSQRIALGGDTTLTNVGASYDASVASRGLGIVQLNFAGVTTLDWGVAVNKIGTGTQSWQLWNETDGVELAVINDSGAAGEKILSGPQVTNGSLPVGEKKIRIRAASTVAADDPVYHGGWLILGSTLPQITYAQARTAIRNRIDSL